MNRKMRVGWWFLVMGILCLGLTLGMTCKKHNQSTLSFTSTFGGKSWDEGHSVQQTSDGGYIIVGSTSSFDSGGHAVWLVKTDASGYEVWDRTFGGFRWDDGNSVRQTTDGGYIIAGSTYSYGAGFDDFWLIKTDASGNKVWDDVFGGQDIDGAYSVEQTSDGGYIVTGYTASYGAGDPDIWLVKTDASGSKTWDKTFGGAGWDEGHSVEQTSDGGCIIVGSITTSGADGEDVWLIKTDSSGDKVWDKTFGGTGSDGGNSVEQTSDGGYIMTGYTTSSGAGGFDVWLVKTDASGNKAWDRTFGGTNTDWGNSVQQTSDGGYVITGITLSCGAGNADVWLIRTDSSGNEVWDKTFGGTDYDEGSSVQQTSDGGYIIAGSTRSYGAGGSDVWLIKTDADRN